jgi:thioesterase domain-containing protein
MYGLHVARRFERAQTVWGLNADWTADGLIKVRSLQELAAGYLGSIRRATGPIPCVLYGFSAAGALAFELASQLQRAGHEVLSVVLGDTAGPGVLVEPRERSREVARRAVRAGDGRSLVKVSRQHLAYRSDQARRWWRGDIREERALDKALADGSGIQPEQRRLHFRRQMGALVALYEPDEPYQGSVTLLRSTDDGPDDLGWGRWVAGDFHLVPVDASHVGMIHEPGLQAAVRVIEEVVLRAGV